MVKESFGPTTVMSEPCPAPAAVACTAPPDRSSNLLAIVFSARFPRLAGVFPASRLNEI